MNIFETKKVLGETTNNSFTGILVLYSQTVLQHIMVWLHLIIILRYGELACFIFIVHALIDDSGQKHINRGNR